MEVVITYIKGYPNKTKLTYRHEDVVQRIVSEWSRKNKSRITNQKTTSYTSPESESS